MSELRKLLKLTNSTYAVTLPNKYLEVLELKTGDFVDVSLFNKKTIAVRKQTRLEKL